MDGERRGSTRSGELGAAAEGPRPVTHLPTLDAELVAPLDELGTTIRLRVRHAMREGQLKPGTRIYHVWKTHYFGGGFNTSHSEETREDWDWSALHDLIESVEQHAGSAIEQAAKALATTATVDLPAARGHLRHFLRLAAQASVEGGSRRQLQRLAQRFLHEASGGAVSWKVNAWLGGISVEGDLKIGAGLRLRAPRSEDFDVEVPADVPLPPWHPSGWGLFSDLPAAILEIERRSPEGPAHEIRKIVNALCLFRPGSVWILKEKPHSDSILMSPAESWHPRPVSTRFSYRVSPADRRRLRAFVSRVAPALPVKPTGVHLDRKSGRSAIGFKQYFHAIHDASDAEDRTALAVASLEGILVRKGETEISRRLAQRTAVLLGFAGLSAADVNRQMKKAYDIRSAFDHGELSTVKGRAEAQAVQATILEYARLALLKHLEVDRWPNDKDKFLNDLDEALLDDSKRRELRKELSGGLWKLAGPPSGGGEGKQ